MALDVVTGKPAPGFGNEGRVDLKKGVLGDLKDGRYALHFPGVQNEKVIEGFAAGIDNFDSAPSHAPAGRGLFVEACAERAKGAHVTLRNYNPLDRRGVRQESLVRRA